MIQRNFCRHFLQILLPSIKLVTKLLSNKGIFLSSLFLMRNAKLAKALFVLICRFRAWLHFRKTDFFQKFCCCKSDGSSQKFYWLGFFVLLLDRFVALTPDAVFPTNFFIIIKTSLLVVKNDVKTAILTSFDLCK